MPAVLQECLWLNKIWKLEWSREFGDKTGTPDEPERFNELVNWGGRQVIAVGFIGTNSDWARLEMHMQTSDEKCGTWSVTGRTEGGLPNYYNKTKEWQVIPGRPWGCQRERQGCLPATVRLHSRTVDLLQRSSWNMGDRGSSESLLGEGSPSGLLENFCSSGSCGSPPVQQRTRAGWRCTCL